MQSVTVRFVAAAVTFVVGVVSASLPPALNPVRTSDTGAEQDVLEVERQYVEAHTRRDLAALDRILADDFVIRFSRGSVTTKAQRLALLSSRDFSFVALDTSDLSVRVSGEEATVAGRAVLQGRYGGREFTSPPYSFTRRYEKRQGRWQIISVRIGRIGWR
ncbi:MAG: nuclear transport factor 2 family protein [Pyrinomonadaceae bacterium]